MDMQRCHDDTVERMKRADTRRRWDDACTLDAERRVRALAPSLFRNLTRETKGRVERANGRSNDPRLFEFVAKGPGRFFVRTCGHPSVSLEVSLDLNLRAILFKRKVRRSASVQAIERDGQFVLRVDEEGGLYINFGKDTISPHEALELLLTPIFERDVT